MATIAGTREVSDETEMITVTRENPPEPAWAAFLAGHGPGDVITATVTQTLPFGALVRSGGVPGLRTDVTGPAVGDRVHAPISVLDTRKHRFSLNG
jgi:hypothetical protein